MAIYIQENFTGGIAEGSKTGLKGAVQDSYGLDYRTNPDELTLLKKLKKDSGTSVTDLIKKFVENSNGDTWAYGDSGKIYKRTPSGTWSNPKTVSDSHGNGIEIFNDSLWYCGDKSLGKATSIDTTAIFHDDYLVTPQYEAPDVSTSTASNTYTLPTTISETSSNKYVFTPTVSTFTGIVCVIQAKGTGDWTFTLHDSSDIALAQVTIANANLPTGSDNVCRVVFAGLDITAGNTYHIHITSTVANGTVKVNTASNLSTAQIAILQSLPDFDVDQSNPVNTASFVAMSNSYTLPTTISENATDKQTFTPLVSSFDGISLLFKNKGSGNIKVTIHNQRNEIVGTATLNNASIKTNATWVKIPFAAPLNLMVGNEYHLHLTSDTASAVSVYTATASDLETVYFKTYVPVINNDENFHPLKVFGNLLCIGNGNVLSTIDDSEVFEREAIVFPKGERVRCLETIGDYLAISTWSGSLSNSTSRIYFWDGSSPSFNAFVTIDGVVNAMKNDGNNMMYIIHGTQCNMSVYTGAITKIRKIKNIDFSIKSYVNPEAIETVEGLLYFANNSSTSSAIDTMVYSYGRSSKEYPYSLNKDYIISTGNRGTTVSIGAMLGISSDKFLISWKDGISYGVDIVDTANDQSIGSFTTLRNIDANDPSREKYYRHISIRTKPLTSAQKITIKRRLNNKDSFELIGTFDGADSAGKHYKCFNIDEYAFEIEFEFTLETSSADAPTLLMYAVDYEPKYQFKINEQ